MAKPKGKTLNITKEGLERLYFVENKTTIEMGELYGCDRKNIDYYFKKYGIPKKPMAEALLQGHANRRGTAINTSEIMGKVAYGMLLQEVAEELHVGRNTLHAHLAKEGISLRNHPAQRVEQSIKMKEKNPVPKGSIRPIDVARKRNITISQNLEYSAVILTNVNATFRQYAVSARKIAYQYYKNNKMYTKGLVIDHILSVRSGYDSGVPSILISHPANLRLITAKENGEKHAKSLCDLQEFHKRIGLRK